MNILTFSTHEGYQYLLSKTGNTFYIIDYKDRLGGIGGWNTKDRPQPENIIFINKEEIKDKNIDLVLYQTLEQYYEYSHLEYPKIILFHVLWTPDYNNSEKLNDANLKLTSRNLQGIKKVFVTETKQKSWRYLDDNFKIIHHGIDTNDYLEWTGDIKSCLRTCHFFQEREWWCGYFNFMKLVKLGIPYQIVGNNVNILDNIYPNSFDELKNFYKNYRVYLYTSEHDLYPISLLEALATGMPLVTTIPEEFEENVFENQVNCLASNDINILKKYCNDLLNDKYLAKAYSIKSKQIINKYFNINNFINNWNSVFTEITKEN